MIVDAAGIVVQVNIELKRAVDRLRRRLRSDRDAFRCTLIGLKVDDPFTVRVDERRQRQASVYDYYHVAELESRYLRLPATSAHGFEYLEALLEEIPLPYVTVRKQVSRALALELSSRDQGEALVGEVVRLAEAFHPLIRFVNG